MEQLYVRISGSYWDNRQSPDTRTFAGAGFNYFGQCPVDVDYDGQLDWGGCGVGDIPFTFSNEYMSLWELDPYSPDDYVTTLTYSGSFTVQVPCDGWGCSSGASGTKSSDANSIASADVRFVVDGAVWDDPQGCCVDGYNYCEG